MTSRPDVNANSREDPIQSHGARLRSGSTPANINDASPLWKRYNKGLPHAMIWDMQIDRGSTTLSVWTRGRGAYVWPLPTALQLQITSITRDDEGHVHLTGLGAANTPHWLQVSDDLVSDPFIDFVPVPVDANGLLEFEDTTAAGLPKRFYRILPP